MLVRDVCPAGRHGVKRNGRRCVKRAAALGFVLSPGGVVGVPWRHRRARVVTAVLVTGIIVATVDGALERETGR